MYENIIEAIELVDFSCIDTQEIYKKQEATILKRLKIDLREKLNIAEALANSLNLGFTLNRKTDTILASSFRSSNMVKHCLLSLPLINYSAR